MFEVRPVALTGEPDTEDRAGMRLCADGKNCRCKAVRVTMDTAGIYDYSFVLDTMADKLIRWQRRLKEQEGAKND